MALYLITHGEYSDFNVGDLIEGPPNSSSIIQEAIKNANLAYQEHIQKRNKINQDVYNAFVAKNPQPPYSLKFSDVYPEAAARLAIRKNTPAYDEEKFKEAQKILGIFHSPRAPHRVAVNEWNKEYNNALTEAFKATDCFNYKTLVDFLPADFKLVEFEMVHEND